MKTAIEEVIDTLTAQPGQERVKFRFKFSKKIIQDALCEAFPTESCSVQATGNPYIFEIQRPDETKRKPLPIRTGGPLESKQKECLSCLPRLDAEIAQIKQAVSKCQTLLEQNLQAVKKDKKLMEVSALVTMLHSMVKQHEERADVLPEIITNFYRILSLVFPYEDFAISMADRFNELFANTVKLARELPYETAIWTHLQRGIQMIVQEIKQRIGDTKTLDQLQMRTQFDRELSDKLKGISEMLKTYTMAEFIDHLAELSFEDPNFPYEYTLPKGLFKGQTYESDLEEQEDLRRVIYNIHEVCTQRMNKSQSIAEVQGDDENAIYCERTRLLLDQMLRTVLDKMPPLANQDMRALLTQESVQLVRAVEDYLKTVEGTATENDVRLHLRALSLRGENAIVISQVLDQVQSALDELRDEVNSENRGIRRQYRNPSLEYELQQKCARGLYYLAERIDGAGKEFVPRIPNITLPVAAEENHIEYSFQDPSSSEGLGDNAEYDFYVANKELEGAPKSTKVSVPSTSYSEQLAFDVKLPVTREQANKLLIDPKAKGETRIMLYRSDPLFQEKYQLATRIGRLVVPGAERRVDYVKVIFQSPSLYEKAKNKQILLKESKRWRQAFKLLDPTSVPDPSSRQFEEQPYAEAIKFIKFVEDQLADWKIRLKDQKDAYDEEVDYLKQVLKNSAYTRKRKTFEPVNIYTDRPREEYRPKDAKQLKSLLMTTTNEDAMMNSFSYVDYFKNQIFPYMVSSVSLYIGFGRLASAFNWTANWMGFSQPVYQPESIRQQPSSPGQPTTDDVVLTPTQSVDMLRTNNLADRFVNWSWFTPSPANPSYEEIKKQTESIQNVLLGLASEHIYTRVDSNLQTADIQRIFNEMNKVNEKVLGEKAVKAQNTLQLLRTPYSKVGLDVMNMDGFTKDTRSLAFNICTDFFTQKKTQPDLQASTYFEGQKLLRLKHSFLSYYFESQKTDTPIEDINFSSEIFQALVIDYQQHQGFSVPENARQFKLQLRLFGFESAVRSVKETIKTMKTTTLQYNQAAKSLEETMSQLDPRSDIVMANMVRVANGDQGMIAEFLDSFKGQPARMDSLHKRVQELSEKLSKQASQTKGNIGAPSTGAGTVVLLSALLTILAPILLLIDRGITHDLWLTSTSLLLLRVFVPMTSGILDTVIAVANMKARAGSRAQLEELKERAKQKTTVVAPTEITGQLGIPAVARMFDYLKGKLLGTDIPDDLVTMVRVVVDNWPRVKERGQLGLTAVYRTQLSQLRRALTRRELLKHSTLKPTRVETERFKLCLWMLSEIIEDNDGYLDAAIKRGSFLFRTSYFYASRLVPMYSDFYAAYVTYSMYYLGRLPDFASAYLPGIALLTGDRGETYEELGFLLATLPDTLFGALGIVDDLVDMAFGSDLDASLAVTESWNGNRKNWEKGWLAAVYSATRGSVSTEQVLADAMWQTAKEAFTIAWKHPVKTLGTVLSLYQLVNYFGGPMAEYIGDLINVMNPDFLTKMKQAAAGAGKEALPTTEESVFRFTRPAIAVINYFTGAPAAVGLKSGDIDEFHKDVKKLEKIISLANSAKTIFWSILQVGVCLAIGYIPVVKNTVQKLYSGGPARILYEIANTAIIGPTRSLAMPWYLSKIAGYQNEIIKQFKGNKEVRDVHSAVKLLRTLMQQNASNNQTPLLVQFPSLPQEFDKGPMKWKKMKKIIERISKSPVFSITKNKVEEFLYAEVNTVLNQLEEHCEFVTALFDQMVFSEGSERSYEEVVEEMVNILGTDDTLNQYKALLERGEKEGMLREIAKTWQFWDNLIKQQRKLYGVYVDFCSSVLGIQETNRIFGSMDYAASALSLLGNFLKLYMLGEWVQMTYQFYFPEVLLTQVEGAPKVFVPFKSEVSLQSVGPITGDIRSVQLTIRRDPSNAVCQDLSTVRQTIGSLTETIRTWTNIDASRLDLFEYCSQGYPVMQERFTLQGLDVDKPLSDAVSKAFSIVLNESLEAIHAMAPHTTKAKYRQYVEIMMK